MLAHRLLDMYIYMDTYIYVIYVYIVCFQNKFPFEEQCVLPQQCLVGTFCSSDNTTFVNSGVFGRSITSWGFLFVNGGVV